MERFKEELKGNLEVEKSKYQLELDKVINRESLLQLKYDSLMKENEKLDKE